MGYHPCARDCDAHCALTETNLVLGGRCTPWPPCRTGDVRCADDVGQGRWGWPDAPCTSHRISGLSAYRLGRHRLDVDLLVAWRCGAGGPRP